jgi:tight adherence protein C
VTLALILGAIVGLGAIVSWRLLFPAPPPLQAEIARLQRRNQLASLPEIKEIDDADFFGRTVGPALVRLAQDLGLHLDTLEANLKLVGRSLEQHLAQKVVLGVFGLVLPMMLGFVYSMAGFGVPITVPALGGIALGAVFFFAPDMSLNSEAAKRTRDFKHALGSYLDLVVISLAGGAGVENALRDAAAVGHGWPFARLRDTLGSTELTGETPWAALTRLGEELRVEELIELSASISLAGTEGARVRESLAVKATSLRDHALTTVEAEANATTEKMALPMVLLFAGFLILIGYPALNAVVTGL